MKITYDVGGELVKEKVSGELSSYYVTESGAQVRKSEVIKFDRRGGAVGGAGRKAGDRKVGIPVYVSREDRDFLKGKAAALGVSVSELIFKHIDLEGILDTSRG